MSTETRFRFVSVGAGVLIELQARTSMHSADLTELITDLWRHSPLFWASSRLGLCVCVRDTHSKASLRMTQTLWLAITWSQRDYVQLSAPVCVCVARLLSPLSRSFHEWKATLTCCQGWGKAYLTLKMRRSCIASFGLVGATCSLLNECPRAALFTSL